MLPNLTVLFIAIHKMQLYKETTGVSVFKPSADKLKFTDTCTTFIIKALTNFFFFVKMGGNGVFDEEDIYRFIRAVEYLNRTLSAEVLNLFNQSRPCPQQVQQLQQTNYVSFFLYLMSF